MPLKQAAPNAPPQNEKSANNEAKTPDPEPRTQQAKQQSKTKYKN